MSEGGVYEIWSTFRKEPAVGFYDLVRGPLITRARCKEITVIGATKHRKEFLSYVAELKKQPIAINTKYANEQHYMQPTEFFEKVLGSWMKYCCWYWEVELSYRDWVKKAYDRTILAYDSHDFGCLFLFLFSEERRAHNYSWIIY